MIDSKFQDTCYNIESNSRSYKHETATQKINQQRHANTFITHLCMQLFAKRSTKYRIHRVPPHYYASKY